MPWQRPPLTESVILRWADEHHRVSGHWPRAASGPVLADPGENWAALETALRLGYRGLLGGDTLAQLLARHGRKRPWQKG